MDLPTFDPSTLTSTNDFAIEQPWGTDAKTDSTHGALLAMDRQTSTKCFNRLIADVATKSCADSMHHLPAANEAVHMLIGDHHSMGSIIPAVATLAAPSTIASLHVATLTYSTQNCADWASMMDAGTIGTLTLICSTYFANTSPDTFAAAKMLTERGARVLKARNHAKVLAFRFSDGRTVTAEGSANTRSCKSLEQIVLFGDPAVYKWHVRWMEEVQNY